MLEHGFEWPFGAATNAGLIIIMPVTNTTAVLQIPLAVMTVSLASVSPLSIKIGRRQVS